ncbi:hypothetical protein [Rhodococcus sp. H29-C3]|uniref:hypothetical protein n=1 Tax=Rhodococcus sp. H29-C3 TaxID=3046307 RepID=UPI0024BB4721|nr:hypothetical protein [Rhodococcus sp. H29-C3]MDJ0360059.1 hypothetical protein [Rhodococcus sp. H29-C3]
MTGYLAMTIADGVSVAVHRRKRSEHPSVFVTDTALFYSGDGTARLGADPSADSTPFVGFLGRVDEPEHSDQEFRAEDLVATAAFCLVNSVTAEHGGIVPHAVLTHPNTWSSHAIDSVRDALDRVDLQQVTLISDEAAAREFFRSNSGDLDQVTVTRGALGIVEAMYPVSSDSADTDALPVVTPAPALAFSEAIPVQVPLSPSGPQSTDTPNSKRPIAIVTAAAIALVLVSIGIAAAVGAFSDGAEVVPPTITDAGSIPATEPSPTPVPAAAVPIPTFGAPPSELPSPESVPTPEPSNTEPPIVETIPAQPLPPPAPETVAPEPSLPLPPTKTQPPRLTFPDFTFPDLSLPGR